MLVRTAFRGLAELRRSMEELPRRVDKKILNDGLLVAARVVRDEARDLAPELSSDDPRWSRGALKRAIRAARIRPREFAAEAIVSVRKLSGRATSRFKQKQRERARAGKKARRIDPRDAYYWFFVEFGTARMPARPFLRPAFERRKVEAVDAAIKFYRQRVQLELAKLGRTIH